MKEVFIIWISISLIVLSVLFPPFGYTKDTLKLGDLYRDNGRTSSFPESKPWTYVRHAFLFGYHRNDDPKLDKNATEWKERERSQSGTSLIVEYEVTDMNISWIIVKIQCLIISLCAVGVFFTFRIMENRKGTTLRRKSEIMASSRQ